MTTIKSAVEDFLKDKISPKELYSKHSQARFEPIREIGKIEITIAGDVLSIYNAEDFIYDCFPPFLPIAVNASFSGKRYFAHYDDDVVLMDTPDRTRCPILDVKCVTHNDLSTSDMLRRGERLCLFQQDVFRDALRYLEKYKLIEKQDAFTPVHERKAHLLPDLQMEHHLHGNLEQDVEMAKSAWKQANLDRVAYYLMAAIFDAAKLCQLMRLPIRPLWNDLMDSMMTFKSIEPEEKRYESDEQTADSRMEDIINEHNKLIDTSLKEEKEKKETLFVEYP